MVIRKLLLIPLIVAAGLFLGMAPQMLLGPRHRPGGMMTAYSHISNFLVALGAYHADTGSFPTTEQGLDALCICPPGVTNW